MRSLSAALTLAKNTPNVRSPYIVLFELEKTGWWRIDYNNFTHQFSAEATVSTPGGATSARIVWCEEVSASTGYLIVEQVSGAGVFTAGDTITDDYGGAARVAQTVDCSSEAGMKFRFAKNLEPITWDGYTWDPMPMAVDAIEASQDRLPTVTLGISNALRTPEAWLRRANGFLGERARLIIVYTGA